ncbi:type II toxin-antitoxin system Phd/YefM family antitoxin [Streptomyces sp. NPDC085596]|uniref:type II toxin-antitoxin system Phd/YefM family antitoxin n=1 Tax=Streptomyces sp. NPDC085596 TaxID=3365731 RepID=UPI0037D28997
MNVSVSEARRDLHSLIKRVNDDHTPVRISSRAGGAILMSAEDYESWQETVYLLRSPANTRRLMEAVARDKGAATAATKSLDGPDHFG